MKGLEPSIPYIQLPAMDYFYMAGTPFESHALSISALDMPLLEIYGVVGETGSGKSTFCRLLTGLLPDREDLSHLPFDNCRENIGYVFQQPEHQLFANTVREELEFALQNFNIPMAEWPKLCEKALTRCGLSSDYLDKSPLILSGGEKRRVAIAAVLVYEPELLVLDEPTAGVDGCGRQILIKTILDYAASGKTIFWVSHELDDILLYTNRCLFFAKGKILDFDYSYQVLRRQADVKTDILRYVEKSGCQDFEIPALLQAIRRKYEQ